MSSFPRGTLLILVVEFFERLAYYAVTFTLMTYCTDIQRMDSSQANAVVNALYIVSPLSACVASGLSDGSWGRRKTLIRFLSLYAVGLACLALSSTPFMFTDFPDAPSTWSGVLLVAGVVIFGIGYGGMKVCTSPLMADCLVRNMTDQCYCEADKKAGLSHLFRWAYWVINFGSLVGLIAAPFLRQVDPRRLSGGEHVGYYYGFWLAALSTLIGTLIFASQFHVFPAQDENHGASYVLLRMLARAIRVRVDFVRGAIIDPEFQERNAWSLLPYAAYHRVGSPLFSAPISRNRSSKHAAPTTYSQNPQQSERHATGCCRHTQTSHANESATETPSSPLVCGCGCACSSSPTKSTTLRNSSRGGVTQLAIGIPAVEAAIEDHNVPAFTDRQVALASHTLYLCRTFVSLPLYWLISNQFSTNVVLQASDLDMPSALPPDLLNNINTGALLISLFVLDRWIFVWMYGNQQKPPVVMRLVVGFLLVTAAMVWCGVLQMLVDERGTTTGSGSYSLNPGETEISAAWVVFPYVLQGIASALVDTTTLEAAYTVAPGFLKSSVMALYLLASSLSGWAGLALSPIMTPQNMTIVFFALAGTQLIVSFLVKITIAEEVDDPLCRAPSLDTIDDGSSPTRGEDVATSFPDSAQSTSVADAKDNQCE